MKEFQDNMKIFIDMSANQKKALDMGDFRKQFDENRNLTEAEKKQANDYVFNNIKPQVEKLE